LTRRPNYDIPINDYITENMGTKKVTKIMKKYGTCNQCGHCCKTGMPSVKREEAKKIARRLKMTLENFIKKHLGVQPVSRFVTIKPNKHGHCPFLGFDMLRDNYICDIHDIRTAHCQQLYCGTPKIIWNGYKDWIKVHSLVEQRDYRWLEEKEHKYPRRKC